MARRGVMTALQAALAGIGGAAGGYVQQQELERKRQEAERERKRQEQRDLLTFGREAITPGPLATRAPAGLPTPEMPAGAPPSAIPMPTGKVDFGGAMRQLEQEEAVPSGTEAIEIGGRTLYIPVGQRYRDIKRSEELQAEQSALDAAIARARAEGQVKREFGEEDFQTTNKRDFDTFKALGGRGEYQPNVVYADMKKRREEELRLAGQRSLLEAREGARAGAGAPGAAGAPGDRGPLPSVLEAISFIDNLSEDDIKKLSGRGVAYATAAPMTMASGAQGFTGAAFGPLVSGMQYGVASEMDRKYAEYASMVSRQVARLNEKGVLSNQDVNDYKTQTGFISGETEAGKARKAQRLREWAQWIARVETGPESAVSPPGKSAGNATVRGGMPNNPMEWR